MPKFTKNFFGCKSKEIHPTNFEVGETCPKELEAAARAAGALPKSGKKPTAAEQKLIDAAAAKKTAEAEILALEEAVSNALTGLETEPDNEEFKTAHADAVKNLETRMLSDAADVATAALEADPENEELKTAKEAAEQALTDALA